jgi:pyruvate/2-oxoglutarate dehydrogenase complex dihydrolipoamide acyltransferase (E2) component
MAAPWRAAHVVVSVPAMGDSVSRGTVVAVLKAPQQAVAVDEVVLVLETDKASCSVALTRQVTVDVRAPVAGTVVQVHAAERQDVAVGQPLLTLDDAAPGTVAAVTPAPAAAAPAAPAPAAPARAPRTPLIRFRHGKRSGARAVAVAPAPPAAPAPSAPSDYPRVRGVKSIELPPTHDPLAFLRGRPALSDAEVAAINSGGALA